MHPRPQDAPLPVKLFEVSDVVLLCSEVDVGARNERRVVAVYSSRESGFEIIHGLLNRVMEVLGVPLKGEAEALCVLGALCMPGGEA